VLKKRAVVLVSPWVQIASCRQKFDANSISLLCLVSLIPGVSAWPVVGVVGPIPSGGKPFSISSILWFCLTSIAAEAKLG